MTRSRTRAALVAAGLMALTLVVPARAQAIDQDLVLSVGAGPPGTEIEVSSASCVGDDSHDAFLDIRLASGAAPDQVLAGIGSGYEGDPGMLVVPDWLDPDAPAEVRASCETYDFDTDEYTLEAYDAVPFDVEPGVDPPTQTAVLSRSSLLAGQAFSVEGTGCDEAGADFASAVVLDGPDLPAGDYGDTVGEGAVEVDGPISVPVGLTNASSGVAVSEDDEGNVTIEELEEIPMDIAPGTYAVVTYCVIFGKSDLSFLVLPQNTVEVTGSAPTANLDLTVPAGERSVTFAGSECTAGPVDYSIGVETLDEFMGFDDGSGDGAAGATAGADPSASPQRLADLPSPFAGPDRPADEGRRVVRRAARLIPGDDFVEGQATPDANGMWEVLDEVEADVDHAVIDGFAVCGDPLAEGFIYDPQLAEVEIAEVPETTTTTTTTTTAPTTTTQPPAVPANAVYATPTYAG